MLKTLLTSLLLCLLCMEARAEVPDTTAAPQPAKRSLVKRMADGVKQFVNSFSDVDTTYIDPPRYIYTVLLQNHYTYELHKRRTAEGN